MGKVAAGTVWSTAILELLGAPLTPQNYKFLNQWTLREHGNFDMYANNPFFTTAGGGGTVGPIKAGTYPLIPDSAMGGGVNSAKVPAYPNLAIGTWINAYHIQTQYPAIAGALRTGNPAAQAGNPAFEQELTTWSGGGYSGFASIAAPAAPVGPTITEPIDQKSVPGGGKTIGQWVPGKGFTALPGQHIPDPNAGVKSGVENLVPGAKLLGRLTDPSYLLRGLQILAGGALVGVGTLLLARQVALAADLPDPAGAVTRAGSAAPTPVE